jgi:hypothetical protein
MEQIRLFLTLQSLKVREMANLKKSISNLLLLAVSRSDEKLQDVVM